MDARNNQATNTGEQGQQTSDFGLLHGSDIEIADLVLKMFRRNQELSGLHPEIISDEGRIYRFNGECWSALDLIEVYRMIHSVDGEKPATGGPVKLSHSRCKSILETIQIRCARNR